VRNVNGTDWPDQGLCYRGGGLPDDFKEFFRVGVKYRVPGFLATSFSEGVGLGFAEQSYVASDGSTPAVLWTVQVHERDMLGENISRLGRVWE
jgi:hypothetical protein